MRAASVFHLSSPGAALILTKLPSHGHSRTFEHFPPRPQGRSSSARRSQGSLSIVCSLLVVHLFGEFIVIPFDPLVDASPLLAHVFSEPPKPRSKTVALVRQYLRQKIGRAHV